MGYTLTTTMTVAEIAERIKDTNDLRYWFTCLYSIRSLRGTKAEQYINKEQLAKIKRALRQVVAEEV